MILPLQKSELLPQDLDMLNRLESNSPEYPWVIDAETEWRAGLTYIRIGRVGLEAERDQIVPIMLGEPVTSETTPAVVKFGDSTNGSVQAKLWLCDLEPEQAERLTSMHKSALRFDAALVDHIAAMDTVVVAETLLLHMKRARTSPRDALKKERAQKVGIELAAVLQGMGESALEDLAIAEEELLRAGVTEIELQHHNPPYVYRLGKPGDLATYIRASNEQARLGPALGKLIADL